MGDSLDSSDSNSSSLTRRAFIGGAIAASATVLIPGAARAGLHVQSPRRLGAASRSLSFYNLHTGERLHATYWEQGEYQPQALDEINYVLRDFRQNEVKPIDPNLLDLLVALRHRLHTKAPYEVISGYRSPITNAMLHAETEGVSLHSMHVEGKAIDLRVPGRRLGLVRVAALSLARGGVGYYPRSGFVHVDTGRVRWW